MPSVSVDVDIELDEIPTDDLVEEVANRIREHGRKKLSEAEKEELKTELKPLIKKLNMIPEVEDSNKIKVDSLDDIMKFEHIERIWNKYSWSDISKLLPE